MYHNFHLTYTYPTPVTLHHKDPVCWFDDRLEMGERLGWWTVVFEDQNDEMVFANITTPTKQTTPSGRVLELFGPDVTIVRGHV